MVFCVLLTSCQKVYSQIDDYHMIYDNVHEANKTFTNDRETLLNFDSYSYCSYMLLFPREQPYELTDFHYNWIQSMDFDDYSVYFSYKLNDTDYQDFKKGLSGFSISYGNQVNKPVYTENLFKYPTYIMTWTDEVENGGVCEYVMLDDDNCTVINVYKMFFSLDRVQKNADYNILPRGNQYERVDMLFQEYDYYMAKHNGYTVYAFTKPDGEMFVPELEELTFDRSFVENN